MDPEGAKFVIHLPGPPRELEPMFAASVAPWLAARSENALRSRYFRLFGIGESDVDDRLGDLERGGNPSLSPYCSLGEVLLRLTAAAPTEAEALALMDPIAQEVRRRLGEFIYDERDDEGGSLEECAERIHRYSRGIIFQTTKQLEDSFDFEGLMELGEEFGKSVKAFNEKVRELYPDAMVLSAGTCTLCKTCTYP